jgi:hypothetical protein
MPSDWESKIYEACWGAAAGGGASLVLYFLQPIIMRWSLTRQISVYPEEIHGSHKRCRVCNRGYWTVAQAMIYIALDYDLENDIITPPKGEDAFVNPNHRIPLRGDQLCWSVRSPTVNPMKVDIFAKERQPFSPCDIRGDCVMIPSEEGWEFPKDGSPRKARVFLRRRRQPYTGFLKIVSADTDACFFRISIDPDKEPRPIEIAPICAMDLPYKF